MEVVVVGMEVEEEVVDAHVVDVADEVYFSLRVFKAVQAK